MAPSLLIAQTWSLALPDESEAKLNIAGPKRPAGLSELPEAKLVTPRWGLGARQQEVRVVLRFSANGTAERA